MSPVAVSLAGLAALAVAMGIGRFAFTPILPMMQADAALSLAAAGWLAGANYAGYLAGALSAPLLRSDRAIRAGLAGIALATLAMGLEQRLASWLALRALAGVASAWVLIHVSSWCLERLAPLRRPALNGTVYAGVGAGSMAAGALCLVLMSLHLGSRDAWLALGVVALVATALLWPIFKTGAAAGLRTEGPGWRAESVRLVLCYAAFGFGYIIPATFIPAMARERVGDPALFGLAWPLFGAVAAASTLAVAPLVRRLGNRGVWIAGHLVMAAGVAAPLVLPGMAGILASAVCVGATFMVITMAGLQEGRRIGGGQAALMAAMTAGFAAGQMAGPAAVSLVIHAGGRIEHASLAACFLLVASACALIPRRTAA
jgi:predicted MFS family arabinose efflux permease